MIDRWTSTACEEMWSRLKRFGWLRCFLGMRKGCCPWALISNKLKLMGGFLQMWFWTPWSYLSRAYFRTLVWNRLVVFKQRRVSSETSSNKPFRFSLSWTLHIINAQRLETVTWNVCLHWNITRSDFGLNLPSNSRT